MATDASQNNLAARLNAEHEALKKFIALLETEQQLLTEGKVDELLVLSEQKTLAVYELNRLAGERKAEMNARGASNWESGAANWFQANAPDNLPQWQDIQQLAEQMRQLNNTNGIIIQTRLRHNQQALIVLHNAVSHSGTLYGRDGQPHVQTSGRTLGTG
jgi:flagella synthesis protein FlgN